MKFKHNWEGKKRTHVWGVIAQEHNPYVEYHGCECCCKVKILAHWHDEAKLITRKQFNTLLKERTVYYADSERRLFDY